MKRISPLMIALLISFPAAGYGQNEKAKNDIATIQTYIDRWVSVTQDLAETKADWQFEKEVLNATKASLQGEVDQIKAQIEDAGKEEQTADAETQKLAAEQVELTKASETVTALIEKLEERLVQLVPKLPPHVRKTIGADLELLNNKQKRDEAGIATRVTTVTNILQAAEQANSDIVTVNEERAVEGKTQSVQTVYFGLALAYSSTEDGSVGWLGTPGDSAWTFEEHPDEAKQIARVVAIANDEADVDFVPVTAKISD